MKQNRFWQNILSTDNIWLKRHVPQCVKIVIFSKTSNEIAKMKNTLNNQNNNAIEKYRLSYLNN